MGSKMLIDAAHSEETRVVVVNGNRIEEFDYESADRKQLKGNIYLAKVTRVEPSLQAAFVDYGGNRHGFLAFSEIHPDYYQIPVADREALLREEAEEDAVVTIDVDANDVSNDAEADDSDTDDTENVKSVSEDDSDDEDDEPLEAEGDDVAETQEEAPKRRRKRQRRYRIQEVIKRRQVILVQVVKEERGNKGAALTTYLSLAGRYCVLMPNTARGGGISRKISDGKDRKRLKEVVKAINVPEGAGLIVRTAGASRTKPEIKRDFDYLLRLWGNIREFTLESTAPSLVYEEGNLIKRSIRDLYNKDVDEVLVEGEQPYKDAKAFMKMLMPSHAKNVKLYEESRPLFSRHQVETQLDALYSPTITLPSGGYLVMNQTEALVSIDINSGKSTREHSIENTALNTNLEASVEIARQLRLRDLAGLVVIDFIDMEERRNNRAVERKLKDALKADRARIQVGRISHFGLMEMSRQRMRQSMLEGTTQPCPHCEGTGLIRSLSSSALSVLRDIEDHLINRKPENLRVSSHREVACFILNEKRDHLVAIEQAYGIRIFIDPSDTISGSDCEISRNGAAPVSGKKAQSTPSNGQSRNKQQNNRQNKQQNNQQPSQQSAQQTSKDDNGPSDEKVDEEKTDGRNKRRRRRRGRRSKRGASDENATVENAQDQNGNEESRDDNNDKGENTSTPEAAKIAQGENDAATSDQSAAEQSSTDETAEKPKKRPRKRTRKPRKKAEDSAEGTVQNAAQEPGKESVQEAAAAETSKSDDTDLGDKADDKKPAKKARKPRKRARKKVDASDAEKPSEETAKSSSDDVTADEASKKPVKKARKPRKKAAKSAKSGDKSSGEISGETSGAASGDKTETAPETKANSASKAPEVKEEKPKSNWKPPQETTTTTTGPAKKGWWNS